MRFYCSQSFVGALHLVNQKLNYVEVVGGWHLHWFGYHQMRKTVVEGQDFLEGGETAIEMSLCGSR